MKIFVSGSIAYDYIMKFDDKFSNLILPDQIDKLNISPVISNMQKSLGGTATNIAYNLGLLGLKDNTVLFGSVGKDFKPEGNAIQYVDRSNIIKIEDDFTACSYTITDRNQSQIIPFYPGAMSKAWMQSLNLIRYDINYAIISPNDKGAMMKHIKECHEKSIKCFFDPGQAMGLYSKEELLECFDYADYLICNEYEFSQILNKTGFDKDKIIGFFDKVIVTLGKNGLFLYEKGDETNLHGLKIDDVVDPTGAGDALRAGLIAGLYFDNSWVDSAKLGHIVATYCIQTMGTTNHNFTIDDIKHRRQQHYGEFNIKL